MGLFLVIYKAISNQIFGHAYFLSKIETFSLKNLLRSEKSKDKRCRPRSGQADLGLHCLTRPICRSICLPFPHCAQQLLSALSLTYVLFRPI